MNYYELTYLISPDVSDPEIESFPQKITDFIKEEDGKTEKSTPLKNKKLGYPIKKKNGAFLGTLDFNLSPDKLPNFEKKLKQQQEILRYTILTKEPLKPVETLKKAPKILLTKKPPVKIPKLKKGKVELKELEKKLEEILDET